jgi:hypothetical protein
MTRSLLACLVVLFAIPLCAQSTPKSIFLTDKTNISPEDILKKLRKDCPNVSITTDSAKSDYRLEAIKTTSRQGLGIIPEASFDLALLDRDVKAVRSAPDRASLASALKDVCHAIKTSVPVEVVDIQNLTQSIDARGDSIAADITGRRTHTDSSTIYVVVKGEHALLDCYERRTGCATIGPGKYYGEQESDGIWINYQMPITHKQSRDHYKIAGSW